MKKIQNVCQEVYLSEASTISDTVPRSWGTKTPFIVFHFQFEFNGLEICSHLHCIKGTVVKLCICYDSTAVTLCAKFCSDLVFMLWITAKYHFPLIWAIFWLTIPWWHNPCTQWRGGCSPELGTHFCWSTGKYMHDSIKSHFTAGPWPDDSSLIMAPG